MPTQLMHSEPSLGSAVEFSPEQKRRAQFAMDSLIGPDQRRHVAHSEAIHYWSVLMISTSQLPRTQWTWRWGPPAGSSSSHGPRDSSAGTLGGILPASGHESVE